MDVFDDEIEKLWSLLHSNDVKFILVGGFATNLHGHNRLTADIDLWLKDSPENRKKLRKALSELGLGDLKEVESMQMIPGWSSVVLNSGIELDLMTSLAGFEQSEFDSCYELAAIAAINTIPIKFLSLDHLIRAKKQVFREKDKIDLAELEKIKRASEE